MPTVTSTLERSQEYGYWHRQLVAGHSDASVHLATMLFDDLPILTRWTWTRWDGHAVDGAISDIICKYLDQPERFSAHQTYLPRYLARALVNRLRDSEDRDKVRRRAEAAAAYCRLLHQPVSILQDQIQKLRVAKVALASLRRNEYLLLLARYSGKPLVDLANLADCSDRPASEQALLVAKAIARAMRRVKRRAAKLLLEQSPATSKAVRQGIECPRYAVSTVMYVRTRSDAG